ncbi:unnamed protein product [Strongylus vulgaris]|uniref:Uncharacterized protein n=1 Tax=Strongylus vulgaris TaxID=40348 RepID=A0A3P7IJ37_STRVU|nr:unnamed protein product [Strongylus vulgaris]
MNTRQSCLDLKKPYLCSSIVSLSSLRGYTLSDSKRSLEVCYSKEMTEELKKARKQFDGVKQI